MWELSGFKLFHGEGMTGYDWVRQSYDQVAVWPDGRVSPVSLKKKKIYLHAVPLTRIVPKSTRDRKEVITQLTDSS